MRKSGAKEISLLRNIPARRPDAHKGDCGRVLVVGGSPGMGGAGFLAAMGAQKSGAGLVTLALPASLAAAGEMFRASIMSHSLADNESGCLCCEAAGRIEALAQAADVCAAGPGIGGDPQTVRLIHRIIPRIGIPLVLDADALNAVGEGVDLLKEMQAPAVLTPHPGEMARLAGLKGASEVQQNRLRTALGFAEETGVVVVLKGRESIVTDGSRFFVNPTGNPGMATGGMGDLLTGIIAALIGQGMDPFDAAALGAFVHGMAGDAAAADLGQVATTPEDVLDRLHVATTRISGWGEEFEVGDKN